MTKQITGTELKQILQKEDKLLGGVKPPPPPFIFLKIKIRFCKEQQQNFIRVGQNLINTLNFSIKPPTSLFYIRVYIHNIYKRGTKNL
jgi:hypothetical protein